ncbi:Mce-associated membrane protein [Marmoricola sp. URHA0025 HA25]
MSPKQRLSVGIAAALVVVIAVADVLLMNAARHDRQEVSAQRDAMRQGRALVPVLLSYDYRTLSSDLGKARRTTTGKFRGDFDKLITSVVRPTAAERHVTTDAVVSAAGVISSTSRRVTLLVFVTQTSTSSLEKSPVVSGSRIKVEMARTGAGWRIAGLDPI